MRDYASAHRRRRTSRKKTLSSRNSTKRVPNGLFGWLKRLVVSVLILGGLGAAVTIISFTVLTFVFPLKESRTLVITGKDANYQGSVFLAHFDPAQSKITMIKLDGEQEVSLLANYGQYRLQAVYPFLQLERRPSSFIAANFGLVTKTLIDGVVAVSEPPAISSQDDLAQTLWLAFKQKLGVGIRGQGERGQLSLRELLAYYRFAKDPAVTWQWGGFLPGSNQLPDYSFISFSAQTCPVAVVNTTHTQGLAKLVADVLENSDLSVVRTTNESPALETSQILYDPNLPDCAEVATQAQKILPNQARTSLLKADPELASRYRAGAVVLVGEDLE